MKVIFKKSDTGILAFYPEIAANYGKIFAFEYIGKAPMGQGCLGGHLEIPLDYYLSLKSAKPNEYAEALENLRHIYDEPLEVRQRINYDDLRYKAWKREVK